MLSMVLNCEKTAGSLNVMKLIFGCHIALKGFMKNKSFEF